MKVVFANEQLAHNPHSFYASGAPTPNPEVPGRAQILLDAAEAAGLQSVRPNDYGLEHIAAVHTDRYLEYFQNIYRRWARIPGGASEVTPGIQPGARQGGYPKSAAGQAGWHHADTASPIAAETFESAKWSAHSAVHGAELLLDGAAICYALARPPGHHASAEVASGFCYFNNAAIAAERLRTGFERVAILDVDVHHGNGTQEIFYARADVLTVSIHADPIRFYPFFWGYAEETGLGDGEGYNLNLPLDRGTGDDAYLVTLDRALAKIVTFRPNVLVVALGLDAHESDPFQGLKITTAGFGRIARQIRSLALPTLLVQEGGYLSSVLGANLSAFLAEIIKEPDTCL